MNARFLLVDLESVQPPPSDIESWMSDQGSAWVFHGPHQIKMLPKYTALGHRVTVIPISRPGKNSLDFHLVFYLGYLTARHPDCKFAVLSKDTGYDPAISHARTLAFDLLRIESLVAPSPEVDRLPAAANIERPEKVTIAKPHPAVKKAPPTKKAVAPKKTPIAAKKTTAAKKAAVSKTNPKVLPGKASPVNSPKSAARALGAVYRDILQELRTQVANRPKSRRALERHVQTKFGPEPVPDNVLAIVDRLLTVEAIREEQGRLFYFPDGLGAAKGAPAAVLRLVQAPSGSRPVADQST